MRQKAEPTAADGPPAIVPARRLAPTEAARRWADLLQQIFEIDPVACPTCHGTMRVVACITQASVIDQILAHFRARPAPAANAGARSPPSTRAPANRSASRAPRPSATARPLRPRPPRTPRDTPTPRGLDRRARQSHQRVRLVPAGISHPTVTAALTALTALTAHERDGGHPAARHAELARVGDRAVCYPDLTR